MPSPSQRPASLPCEECLKKAASDVNRNGMPVRHYVTLLYKFARVTNLILQDLYTNAIIHHISAVRQLLEPDSSGQ